MKAYKVFNPDWTCKNFKYEVGKTYKLLKNGKLQEPILCERGFHACSIPQDCFNYYPFNPDNKVALVELNGTVLGTDSDKQCSNIITIVEEIPWKKLLTLVNTGKGNSGYGNSGDGNSGYRNSGYGNSGNRNSGDGNSGDENSGNFTSCSCETGFFNSVSSLEIRVFNKPCLLSVWENTRKPNFTQFTLNEWVSFEKMSEEEKINYPKAYITDGYLKTYSYKEAWANAYAKFTKEEIALLKALPNFDPLVFKEITGIEIG